MHNQAQQQPANKNNPSASQSLKMQSGSKSNRQQVDNRLETVAQQKLQQGILGSAQLIKSKAYQEMADNSARLKQNDQPQTGDSIPQLQLAPVSGAGIIQRYTYQAGTTRTVKVSGATKSRSFEECTKNSVEFSKGDKKPDTGTTTGTAAWADWLKNQTNSNNATQLHVVNRRWGGLGGSGDKNIVPGTPAVNSHHLHEAEVEFDKCFDSSHKAINNCKYVCSATPAYGTAVDVSSGDVHHNDPAISVAITDNGSTTNHSVTPGGGVTFKDANV
jgi:hypothetical protein